MCPDFVSQKEACVLCGGGGFLYSGNKGIPVLLTSRLPLLCLELLAAGRIHVEYGLFVGYVGLKL